jgi:hypothetical protein
MIVVGEADDDGQVKEVGSKSASASLALARLHHRLIAAGAKNRFLGRPRTRFGQEI